MERGIGFKRLFREAVASSPHLTTSSPQTQRQQSNCSNMSSSSESPSRSNTPSDNANAIPDAGPQEPDLPLTMASSMILTSLPRDAAAALSAAGDFPKPKVTVQFKAVGSAPSLRSQVCKISSTQRFEAVVSYLSRVLRLGPADSVFLYVNSSFAPALDEIVGNLHRVSYPYFVLIGHLYHGF